MARERKSKKIPLKHPVIIFSDGETELNYFNCKKSDMKGNRNIKIATVPTNSNTATKMVLYAINHIRSRDKNPNDKYFCVLDMDCADDDDIGKALKKKPDNMELIISNPDFEFWLLLHYRYYQGRLGNREPIEKLR